MPIAVMPNALPSRRHGSAGSRVAAVLAVLASAGCAQPMQPAPAAPAPAAAKDRHDPAETLLSARSPHNYADTVARIERMAAERGLTVFARIDHAAEARKVGMTMPPTLLLIVGNPTGGTPMMLAQPSSAIDLPLKVLIQQFGDGKVGVTINSAKLLQHRHGLTEEQTRPAAALQGLVDAALR